MRLASYPDPYPDGWYRLLGSKSLRRGQVRCIECLGRALVVWRSEDADDVSVMAAFCPHLGANLGHGGHYNAGHVRAHMIELIENAADPAHFGYLHNQMNFPVTQIPVPGVKLEHTAHLGFDEDREPCQIPLLTETVLEVFGRRLERSRAKTRLA